MNFSSLENVPRRLTRTGAKRAFNISFISKQSGSLDVSGTDTDIEDILMHPDGTMFYVVGNTTDTIYQYQCCIPYNTNTAQLYASKDVSSETTDPTAMAFDSTGAIMYVADGGTGIVYLYDLSTEYDVSTAVYSGDTLDFSDDTTGIVDLIVTDDGIVIVDGSGEVLQYNINSYFTSRTGVSKAFDAASYAGSIQAKPDGTKIYAGFSHSTGLHTYTLGTGWDYATISGPVNNATAKDHSAFFITSNGTTLLTSETSTDDISVYTLSTPWDMSSRSANTDYTLSEIDVMAVYHMYMSDDGYHFFMAARDASDYLYYLYEYSLSVAFDFSSRTFVRRVSHAGPFWFNSAGTKLVSLYYGVIYQYSLTSAFNISTLVTHDSLTFLSNILSSGLNVDTGRLLYIRSVVPDDIYETFLLNMSDASTLDISSQTTDAVSAAFSDSGDFFVVMDADGDILLQYYATTSYDIANGIYQDESIDPSLTTPGAIDISSNAGYVYVTDNSNDYIYIYTLG